MSEVLKYEPASVVKYLNPESCSPHQVDDMVCDDEIPIYVVLNKLKKHRACVSARQASEWGMRAVQTSFRVLKQKMYGKDERRRMVLQCSFMMYNLRVRKGLPNQIRTVYSASYLPPLESRRVGQQLHRAMMWQNNDGASENTDRESESEADTDDE
jgi:hypothetical protein